MERNRLEEFFSRFSKEKIAVVGDYFLDKWLTVDREKDEPSVETGKTAYQVVKKRCYAGAAGTVITDLAVLGVGELYAVGFLGNDGEGFEIVKDLAAKGVNTDYLVKSEEVVTPTYMKPMHRIDGIETEGHRLDIKNFTVTPRALEDRIIDALWDLAPKVDAVIALDQLVECNCGVLTERVRGELSQIAEAYPRLIVYADSRSYIRYFKKMIVKCNNLEVIRTLYPQIEEEQPLEAVGKAAIELAAITGERVFVTCGKRGVISADANDSYELIPTVEQTGEIDIVGAGDACTSGIVASLCAGAVAEEAAFVGNLVSGVTIRTIGSTGTATQEQVMKLYLERYT